MLKDGTHGVFSTAKYVWFPAVVIVGSEITFVQRNPMSKTVERPRTMRENARATARAARSDPVRYVKTAPTAGRRTMYVRIGNSINILEPSQPGERPARVRVDHPEERHGEEADEEDEGHEDDVRDSLPRKKVMRMPELLRDITEQDALHRVQVVRGRHDDRDQRDDDQPAHLPEVRRSVRPDEDHELGPERIEAREAERSEEADREDERELRHDFREALELGNVPAPGSMLHRAGEHEQDRRDNPVVEHLEDRALDANHREARGAQEDEPHVPDRAVRDQSLQVHLGEADERRVHHRDGPKDRENPPQVSCGVGEDSEVDPEDPVPAHLQEDARQENGASGRRLDVSVREPRVERERGELHEEANQEGCEHRNLQADGEIGRERAGLMPQGGVEERGHVEGVCVRSIYGGVHAGAVEVEGKDRKEHDHEPNLCENEEVQRRVSAGRSTPDSYQEEHRDDHEFPENREEQEVEGHEDTDECHLEEQEEAEECLRPVLLVPVENDRECRQQSGEPDERDAQTVDTNDVIETKLGPPRIPLHIVQRDIGACRWRRGRGRSSKQHAPARVDEAEEKGRRERGLYQTEGERDQLRQAV